SNILSDFNASTKLQYLGDKKSEKSAQFFKDTKVQSCSYISLKTGVPQAIPYYCQPNKTYADKMSKSSYQTSFYQQIIILNYLNQIFIIYRDVYKVRPYQHVGMNNKPLDTYHPHSYRNRLPVQDAPPQFTNASQIEVGDRSEVNHRRFVSQSRNVYGNFGKFDPVTNTGIIARQTKWHHHLQQK
ncbi:hypothetical protein IMG5_193190, partial [Ichthyophthirius multifiliis]